jgi:hypothetical protein
MKYKYIIFIIIYSFIVASLDNDLMIKAFEKFDVFNYKYRVKICKIFNFLLDSA